MPRRDITLAVRALGARQASHDLQTTSLATRRLGASARSTSSSLHHLGGATDSVSRSMSTLATWTKRGVFSLGAMGVAATVMGLRFNAAQEQNQIALTRLLGSTSAAQAEMKALFNIATATPFQLEGVTSAAKQLLAFGFGVTQANRALVDIADAASGLGGGTEEINRLTTALGQMRVKGVVQGDELLQFQEAGVNVYRYLERAGLITQKDIGHIGDLHIKSAKAIGAIMAGIEADFGGMSKAQSKTFTGMVSTLKDLGNQLAGTLTRPLFLELEREALPRLTKFAERANAIWAGKGTFGQKFRLTEGAATPMVNDLVEGLKRAQLDRKLVSVIEWAVPTLAHAFEKAGPPLAEGLWKGFKAAPVWAKVLGVGLVLRWFGLGGGGGGGGRIGRAGPFGMAGGLAAATFRQGFDAGLVKLSTRGGPIGKVAAFFTGRGSSPANPLYVVDVAGRLPGGAGGVGGKVAKLGKFGKFAASFTGVGAVAVVGYEVIHQMGWDKGHAKPGTMGLGGVITDPRSVNKSGRPVAPFNPLDPSVTGNLGFSGHMASGGVVGRSGLYEVGERGSEVVHLPKGAYVEPHDRDIVVNLTANTMLNEKVIAQAVHREVVRKASTR
jgi:tape measure domain-containing protein